MGGRDEETGRGETTGSTERGRAQEDGRERRGSPNSRQGAPVTHRGQYLVSTLFILIECRLKNNL